MDGRAVEPDSPDPRIAGYARLLRETCRYEALTRKLVGRMRRVKWEAFLAGCTVGLGAGWTAAHLMIR